MIEIDSSPMKPEELKEIRKDLGWTLNEMADSLSIDISTPSRYEMGKRIIPGPFAALMRILRTLKKKETN